MNRATEIHTWFAARPGNTQVATRFACEGLAWWLGRCRPLAVLDVGAGYGTLTAVASDHALYVTALEDDPHCRRQWSESMRDWRLSAGCSTMVWTHAEWTECMLPLKRQYDAIVVDGGDGRPTYYASVAHRGIIFFEGRRRSQREVCAATLRASGRGYCEAEWKPPDRSKGYVVMQLDPKPIERLWFALVRAREWWRDQCARWRGRPAGKRRNPCLP